MLTYFVCLANSKKYGERCIAGIEMKKAGPAGFQIIKTDHQPKWIRPVTGDEHGQVPADLVRNIKLLDILEIEVSEKTPEGYQSENVLFEEMSIQIVGKLNLSVETLDGLTSSGSSSLFGNKGKAVATEKIDEVSHSLMFIKVSEPQFYYKTGFGASQLRVKFNYWETEYDLPVTDIHFEFAFLKDEQIIAHFSHFYLTVSLGVEHEGWYFKLVAGVVFV